MKSTLLIVALALGMLAGPLAQTGATGSVSGVVITGAGGTPVRLAIVTIEARGATPSRRAAVTDDAGRFSFIAVPDGSYMLRAAKSAHITNAYGARRPGGPGTPITVAAGEPVRDLRVELPRGAVITGTVRDQTGQPAPNTAVSAIRPDALAAPGRILRLEEVLTDDRGMYRIYGLMPGEYLVAATMRATGVGEMGAMTAAEIDAAMRELQSGRASTAPDRAGATAAAQQSYGFASTFHPSAIDPGEATRIRVEAGEERRGVDIAAQLVRTATIDGSVTSPDGAPPPPSVGVMLQGSAAWIVSTSFDSILPFSYGRLDPTGRFQLPGVTPGRYRVMVRTSPSRRGGVPGPSLWAAADVVVNGEDITGLALMLRPGMQVSGNVIVDAVGDLQDAPAPEQLQVRLMADAQPASGQPAAVTTSSIDAGVVLADGSFVIDSVMPGRYRPAVASSTPLKGWLLASAIVDGRDVMDYGLEVDTQDVNAVLTFTNRYTELTGSLQTPAGQPAPDYVVIVFPADRTLWRPRARRIQTVRPDTAGRFTFRGLPPGDYRIAALTDIEPDQSHDPELLSALLPASVALTLKAGENRRQDLRIGGDLAPRR